MNKWETVWQSAVSAARGLVPVRKRAARGTDARGLEWKHAVRTGVFLATLGGLPSCALDDNPPKDAEPLGRVHQRQEAARGLAFTITGVKVGGLSHLDFEDTLAMTTSWDDPPLTDPVVFACGQVFSSTFGTLDCAATNTGEFHPYPDYLSNPSSGILFEILSEERHVRAHSVSITDTEETIDVQLGLTTTFLNSTLEGAFSVKIDLVTPGLLLTPQFVGGDENNGLSGDVCGFRSGGMEFGSCAAAHTCPFGDECNQDCVFMDLGWELCYDVVGFCVPTGQEDNNCDGVDDDCNGVADDLFVGTSPVFCGLTSDICPTAAVTECVDGEEVNPCGPCPEAPVVDAQWTNYPAAFDFDVGGGALCIISALATPAPVGAPTCTTQANGVSSMFVTLPGPLSTGSTSEARARRVAVGPLGRLWATTPDALFATVVDGDGTKTLAKIADAPADCSITEIDMLGPATRYWGGSPRARPVVDCGSSLWEYVPEEQTWNELSISLPTYGESFSNNFELFFGVPGPDSEGTEVHFFGQLMGNDAVVLAIDNPDPTAPTQVGGVYLVGSRNSAHNHIVQWNGTGLENVHDLSRPQPAVFPGFGAYENLAAVPTDEILTEADNSEFCPVTPPSTGDACTMIFPDEPERLFYDDCLYSVTGEKCYCSAQVWKCEPYRPGLVQKIEEGGGEFAGGPSPDGFTDILWILNESLRVYAYDLAPIPPELPELTETAFPDDNIPVTALLSLMPGESPIAVCQDVSLDAGTGCTAEVTSELVDAGSSDPNGDPLELTLSSPGLFPVGTTPVALTASDGSTSDTCTAEVTVHDVTAPVLTLPPDIETVPCGTDAFIPIGEATATDNCFAPSVTGRVTSTDGVPLSPPIDVVDGWVELGPGTHVVEWTASDGTSTTTGTQVVTVSGDGDACSQVVPHIAAGFYHSCALGSGGRVRCWGWNHYGQLGYGHVDDIGDDEYPSVAGDVDIGGSATQIVGGRYHTCVLRTDGAVLCWGQAGRGRLGYGNTEWIGDDETPSSAGAVAVGGTVTQVVAGDFHTCALLSDGSVSCWGDAAMGQLGYGNTEYIGDDELPVSAGPVDVGGVVKQLAAGLEHTCALLVDGSVRCWGSSEYGQLGYGNMLTIGDDETPASVGTVDVGGSVAQIAASGWHTCALLVDGSIRCWGRGLYGRLGYGYTDSIGDDEVPASAAVVSVGGEAQAVAVGRAQSCALLSTGDVRCWGQQNFGRLGINPGENVGDDELPSFYDVVPVGGQVDQIVVGGQHACVHLTTGGVRCWGRNNKGQLGYGNTLDVGIDITPAAAGDAQIW